MLAPPALTLLGDVCWRGRRVPGERVAALLSALAHQPSGVSDAGLVERVWRDEVPANPVKALQVLVSRVRSQCGPDALVRADGGYRLGLAADDVDVLLLRRLAVDAEAALAAGDAAAVGLADRALALAGPVADHGDETGARADLLDDVRRVLPALRRCRSLALAAAGRHADALPGLVAALESRPGDITLLTAALRSEAASAGAPAALDRYEAYRADLADRLGVDPDPALQRLHAELLAADDPVRTGLRFDVDELLGRADDLTRLRAALTTGRLTTVLGPGGIGKTRIAQLLARESAAPRVHFVELVGLSAADDVVAEVGAALGVRGSVASRHTLTPAQLADVRARMAQELDSGPTLLVLDNCEHVLEAVASLVAFLLVTTRDLRVLVTSRAPLRIAAERVVPLTLLDPSDAGELFVRRVRAVRPDAELDPEIVRQIVTILDGLPLAIEIAAARVRTMSVSEVRRRLAHRFDLLRTRDRGVPDRHRTLAAVIEWSWDLLAPDEQRALSWMSVFHDGFDAGAAEAMLGTDGPDLVEALVEQSLVVVSESEGAVRLRMLETVREFAGLRLDAARERAAAGRCQRDWAVGLAGQAGTGLFHETQVAAVDVLRREDNNLTDVLRRSLRSGDVDAVATLIAALGAVWMMTGEHARIFALADSIEPLLTGWDPPDDLRVVAQEALATLAIHLSWLPGRPLEELTSALRRWGVPDRPWARSAYAMFVEAEDTDAVTALAALAGSTDDPTTRQMALMWASLLIENTGDVAAAIGYAELGLRSPETTPYLVAALRSQLAQLALLTGDHQVAAAHAELVWPQLVRLHALDDARSLRLYTALAPLMAGDLDECARVLGEVEAMGDSQQLGSRMMLTATRAELAIARGDVEAGLAAYDEAVESVRASISETMVMAVAPWLLIAASSALIARVRHGRTGASERRAAELCQVLARGVLEPDELPYRDLPLSAVALAGIGAWQLRFGDAADHEDGVRLLAVADQWAYNRSLPSMAWAPLAAMADAALPGRLSALREEYADRPGYELVPEAREVLAQITSSG